MRQTVREFLDSLMHSSIQVHNFFEDSKQCCTVVYREDERREGGEDRVEARFAYTRLCPCTRPCNRVVYRDTISDWV